MNYVSVITSELRTLKRDVLFGAAVAVSLILLSLLIGCITSDQSVIINQSGCFNQTVDEYTINMCMEVY